MHSRVVVLGAGFGGLELTTILPEAFGDAIDIVIVDKGGSFVFGFSKPDMLVNASRWCASRTDHTGGYRCRPGF